MPSYALKLEGDNITAEGVKDLIGAYGHNSSFEIYEAEDSDERMAYCELSRPINKQLVKALTALDVKIGILQDFPWERKANGKQKKK